MRTEAGTNKESAEESGVFFLIVAKYTGGTICCFTHSQVCSLAVLSAFATACGHSFQNVFVSQLEAQVPRAETPTSIATLPGNL